MNVDFEEKDIDLIITYRAGNVICYGTICLVDIYNIENQQLVSNVSECIVEELRSAIEHAKYDIEDKGVHIIERLERNEYSIFVTNSRGCKKPVSFSKPRELKTFCKHVISGDKGQIIASFGEPPVQPTVRAMLSSTIGAAMSNQNNDQAVDNIDHDNQKKSQYLTSVYKQALFLYDEITEKERNLNNYIFWLKFNRAKAHKKYMEWKESLIPQFEDMKVNHILARIKPMHREKLNEKINLTNFFKDITSAILVPASARLPPQDCKGLRRGKRCNDENDIGSNFYEVVNSVFLLVQGALQVGKSEIEALYGIIASEFQIPCIMITNKVAFSANLKAKVKMHVKQMDAQSTDFACNNIFCITENDDTAVRYNDNTIGLVQRGKLSGAVLVIGDTHSKVMKLEHYYFVAIDESDIVTCRNRDRKVSQALRMLLALGPMAPSSTSRDIGGDLYGGTINDGGHRSNGDEQIDNSFGGGDMTSGAGACLIALISASPVSNIVDLMVIGAQNVKPFRIKPGLNYAGFHCFKPMQNEVRLCPYPERIMIIWQNQCNNHSHTSLFRMARMYSLVRKNYQSGLKLKVAVFLTRTKSCYNSSLRHWKAENLVY